MTHYDQKSDALLKEYNDLDIKIRNQDLPEKDSINGILLFVLLSSLAYFIIFIHAVSIFRFDYVVIYYLTLLLLLSQFFIFRKVSWVKLVYPFILVSLNLYITYQFLQEYTVIMTLVDGLTIGAIANNYLKKGYYIAASFITLKIILLFYLFPPVGRSGEDLIGIILNTNSLGLLPWFILKTSISTLKMRKQQLRAQILAIQNNELSLQWANAVK